jgi:hypothetical protein
MVVSIGIVHNKNFLFLLLALNDLDQILEYMEILLVNTKLTGRSEVNAKLVLDPLVLGRNPKIRINVDV